MIMGWRLRWYDGARLATGALSTPPPSRNTESAIYSAVRASVRACIFDPFDRGEPAANKNVCTNRAEKIAIDECGILNQAARFGHSGREKDTWMQCIRAIAHTAHKRARG